VNDNDLTRRIIACAIEVHKRLGAGLLESVYEAAMAIELGVAGFEFEQQVQLAAKYRDHVLGYYRLDFVVESRVVVEVKAVLRLDPVFESQILTYMRVAKLPIGLLINFNSVLLTEGVRRFVL